MDADPRGKEAVSSHKHLLMPFFSPNCLYLVCFTHRGENTRIISELVSLWRRGEEIQIITVDDEPGAQGALEVIRLQLFSCLCCFFWLRLSAIDWLFCEHLIKWEQSDSTDPRPLRKEGLTAIEDVTGGIKYKWWRDWLEPKATQGGGDSLSARPGLACKAELCMELTAMHAWLYLLLLSSSSVWRLCSSSLRCSVFHKNGVKWNIFCALVLVSDGPGGAACSLLKSVSHQ